MKNFLVIVTMLFISNTCLLAQNTKVIKGRVVDSLGNALSGASIVVSGLKSGTQSNVDGNFSINLPDDNKARTLTVSYVGFTPVTVAVKGNNIVVQLKNVSDVAADEVVVIGYQSVRRKDVLASVASVSAKDLKDIPINSVAEALNGRLAGVTATTAEGSPDAQVTIRVRGGGSITQDNSPLYIIDGVQVENGLSNVVLQDIQTIDVLKDAAATAIYGARGANGVIVITTKTGKVGKLRVSYNAFVGVKNLPKTLEVLSPYEFIVYEYERTRGSNADSTSFARKYGTTWDTLANYKNVAPVNWQKEVLGQTGFTQSHNVSASGGTKKTTYNFSYTNNTDKAIVRQSTYQRNQLNIKAEHKLTSKLKIGISARYTNQQVLGAGTSDERGASFSRLRNSVKYRPYLTAGYEADEIDPNLVDLAVGNGLFLVNPIQLTNSEYRKKSIEAYNITANLSYNITKNLSFRSTFGIDNSHTVDRQFVDSIASFSITQGSAKPIVRLDTSNKNVFTNSNVLTFSIKNFKNKHDFDILLGQETYTLTADAVARQFRLFPNFTTPNTAFTNTGLGTSFAGFPIVNKYKSTQLSFFGRVNYAYKNKYLFAFNLRTDASSKFAENLRWGYFPSGSFAWRVSNEKFLKNSKFINDLKVRVGYGQVGNNRIDDYLFLTTFNTNPYYYGINGQIVNAFTSAGLVNEKLLWETTTNQNLGLDVAILKNRISLSLDVYHNTTKDLLLNVPIAGTYGNPFQLQNVGKTSNKGVEIQLNALVASGKNNFSWNANFNMSFNNNTVVAVGKNATTFPVNPSWSVTGQQDYLVKVGEPVGSMYGLVTDGFYTVDDFDYNTATRVYSLKTGKATAFDIAGAPQPGSIKFKDLNGDGKIVYANDATIIGNANAKFTGGLNQQFTYKQWDMSVFLNFSYGNDVYNANKIEFTNGYTQNSNLLTIMQNRWRTVDANGNVAQSVNGSNVVTGIAPDQLKALNANATIWQPIRSTAGSFVPHSWAIEDGSFLRVNNITLGYSLPIKTLTKLKISRLRLYATANNVAVLTSYSGYDPEVSVRRSPLTPGLDYSAYPKSRTFLFGINVNF
ncbi:MAG: TonB-dependent receptor [Deinococcales bacterium]|nr:TonB-dependent receptor [Chitinophagaceae bacterium]